MSLEFYTLKECDLGIETAQAILVRKNGVEHWIPLSMVDSMMRSNEPRKSSIRMTAWIAKRKCFID